MERSSHPCLTRGCRHPDTDHVVTPELAGREEVVVWCFGCRRHESRESRRWFQPWFRKSPPAASDFAVRSL